MKQVTYETFRIIGSLLHYSKQVTDETTKQKLLENIRLLEESFQEETE